MALFEISVDRSQRLISLKLTGLWDEARFETFKQAMRRAIEGVASDGGG